jgi:hypothetical protein
LYNLIIISYDGTTFFYNSTEKSGVLLTNDTGTQKKNVPIVVLPYEKRRGSITIYLKDNFPELFDVN